MASERTVTYVGRCDNLKAEDLDAFDDTSRDICNQTFRRTIGPDLYADFQRNLRYGRRHGIWLSKDFHVSYVKGIWKEQRAVCCFWSEFHHIFTVAES